MEGGDLTSEQVLSRDIPWETYMTAKLITGTDLQLLRRYDHRTPDVRSGLMAEDGPAYIKTFVAVLRNVSKEETLEYTLALIDEQLAAAPERAKLFHDPSLAGDDVYNTFLRLLSRESWFVQEKACRTLTLIISERSPVQQQPAAGMANGIAGSSRHAGSLDAVLSTFVDWLCGQLRHPAHASRSPPTAVHALAVLLRESSARALFVRADGVRLLAPLISPASSQQHMQLLYETILCVWLLTFYDPAVESIAGTRIVPRLVDVSKGSTKEKVVRVAVLSLKNLLKKGGTLGDSMVELGLPKVVQSLKQQAWTDEDLKDALGVLEAGLKANIVVLSSFDKYKQEVLSGSLDWTPMHKDPAFWRGNITRFEENDFQVLRVLVTLMDTSKEPRTLAVAAHDLGQFIQNHPSGRNIALDLKAKDKVVALMASADPDVQKQALLCVQKLLLSAKYASYIR